jgi:hypothetical protein
MLDDYRKLEGLLSQQKDALAEGDFERLGSLREPIAILADRVAANDLSRLRARDRVELETLIRRIDEQIRENRSSWQKVIEQVQDQTTQLRARRRYFSAVHTQPPIGSRYSRTG